MRPKGFTLNELLVVAGIIAILAAASVANYAKIRRQGLEPAAQAHGGAVIQALQGYLALYLSETPSGLLGGQLASLPSADYTGAPGGMPRPTGAKGCTAPYTLRSPSGTPTPYAWPQARRGVGCVLGLGPAGQFLVLSWVQGGGGYYANGTKAP